jgi:hypothetical protein
MAVFKPELHNADDVINYYENSPATHYKVYAGTSAKSDYCRFNFDEDEKMLGKEKLADALHSIQQNIENTNPYLLQLIEPKTNPKSKEGDKLTSIIFQLNKSDRFLPIMGAMGAMGAMNNNNNDRLMEKLIEQQNVIISKLSADEYEEDLNEEDNKPKGFGAILESEQFQALAMGAIGALLNKFLPVAEPPVMALAGVPTEQMDKANEAIQLLKQRDQNYGDHLLYLAKIDNAKYNILLSFMQ